ncbi:hypothetical protein HMPREF9720_1169 [Alistipes sp. HGB5]|nr:hypothetical protein HMPREF9720_1169 [Alistipes sp. HGB5]
MLYRRIPGCTPVLFGWRQQKTLSGRGFRAVSAAQPLRL